MSEATAQACNEQGHLGPMSAEISVILVFFPCFGRPVPLIVQSGIVCAGCRHVFEVVSHAVSLHRAAKDAGEWSRAIVLFVDGTGLDVKQKSGPRQLALA